jgi:hypothetical protein
MKFLSIDVGIKNLSFCLFSKELESSYYEIKAWDNIDLTEIHETKCIEIEKNNICGKPAKFKKDSKCYCAKHSKKINYLLPNPEFQLPFLNKQKLENLIDLANKYNIYYQKPCKKIELINIISDFSNKNCLESIGKTNASKVDLVTIGKNIQHKFDLLFQEHIINLNTIIIENQIGPLANKMKTIQGMLAQYFIMKNNNIRIDFISSTNKLKDFIKESDNKLDYKQRKQLGIKTCLEVVSSDFKYAIWNDFLQKHKKKDDLSDCFLQGLWYIKHKL